MSDELALGQRELSVESVAADFSAEEKEMVFEQAFAMLVDILKVSGSQTLTAVLGELAQNAAAGLAVSAQTKEQA